ncbi:reverse transcriptase [Purpureocillium lilacinum]|uniref:Reverse transcriptase n=1 Tax=Purpureocillium lilacinum TaxID=33203 RepID=A0A179EZY1_PURLI|nr:reverse transcriptase [Purpureocillium lilacinum]
MMIQSIYCSRRKLFVATTDVFLLPNAGDCLLGSLLSGVPASDLTRLRQIYTFWRNQARARRRAGSPAQELEKQAKEAAKKYHDAVRKQKRQHWEEFLAEDGNIWKASKYLGTRGSASVEEKVPPVKKEDGTTTMGRQDQAEELLRTFFPPLPTQIEAESEGSGGEEGDGRQAVEGARGRWPAGDGVERAVAGGQGTRAAPVLTVTRKRKPDKEDYTAARAWRPVSLLSTLGKVLEAVVAERVSYAVETHGLLPANHFGARKRRSAEQALILLQENIYRAWRMGKVLSLVGFDVKGAYNGVFKERLLQRLAARGLPGKLVRWVDVFCSERTAGLPQGSPLSPILFLFFNADLVQASISTTEGAIAFVDDYSACVTGKSAAANRARIEAIIDRAMAWARRSGATFESNKTACQTTTKPQQRCRTARRGSQGSFVVNGQTVQKEDTSKVLGVVEHPLARLSMRICQRFTSPMQTMALRYRDETRERLGKIREYAIAPWESRIRVACTPIAQQWLPSLAPAASFGEQTVLQRGHSPSVPSVSSSAAGARSVSAKLRG